MRLSEVLDGLGNAVAYYPGLARPLGGVKAAVLFGQFFYWHRIFKRPEFFVPLDEVASAVGFTAKELRLARERLIAAGVLRERYARAEHKLYFRIDFGRLDELWGREASAERADAPPAERADGHLPKGQIDPSAERADRKILEKREQNPRVEVGMPISCSKCGYQTAKPMGRCPNCNEWETFGGSPKAPKVAKSTSERYREHRAKLSAASPKPRSSVEILGSELDRWFKGSLLKLYRCPNPLKAAEILREIDPDPELCERIIADIRARYANDDPKYWPPLTNYLTKTLWIYPLADAEPKSDGKRLIV